MSQPEAPKIEFPCADFLIKIVGGPEEDYQQFVVKTIKDLCPEFNGLLERKLSGKGNYCSYNLRVTAQSPEHLSDINTALRQDSRTKMVL